MNKKVRIYSGNSPFQNSEQQSRATLYIKLSKETRKKIHNLYLENSSMNRTRYNSFYNNRDKINSFTHNKTNSYLNTTNNINISSRPQSNTHFFKK